MARDEAHLEAQLGAVALVAAHPGHRHRHGHGHHVRAHPGVHRRRRGAGGRRPRGPGVGAGAEVVLVGPGVDRGRGADVRRVLGRALPAAEDGDRVVRASALLQVARGAARVGRDVGDVEDRPQRTPHRVGARRVARLGVVDRVGIRREGRHGVGRGVAPQSEGVLVVVEDLHRRRPVAAARGGDGAEGRALDERRRGIAATVGAAGPGRDGDARGARGRAGRGAADRPDMRRAPARRAVRAAAAETRVGRPLRGAAETWLAAAGGVT